MPDWCLSSALAFPSDLGARRPCRGLRGWGCAANLLDLCFRRKVKVKVTQSCPTLCYPTDYTVHGILQARILEWVAFLFSRGSTQPRDGTQVSHIPGGFFLFVCCCLVTKYVQLFCNPMHCSLPGLYVHGTSQARILEWVAISFSSAGQFFTS